MNQWFNGKVVDDMENMRYTEALRKLFEVMEGRADILEVKFNRDNDTFEVIENTGVHICFGDEFRNKQL